MHKVVESTYNRATFNSFLKEFLPEDYEIYKEPKTLPLDKSRVIKAAYSLGESASLDNLKVFEIEHESQNDPRIKLASDAFRIMADTLTHRALIVFRNSKTNSWRLSLMTVTLEYDETKNKIKSKPSNPRRYSYILGEGAKTATPQKFLINKGRISSFEDLVARFSAEVVNNEFYQEIARLYDKLVGTDKRPGVLVYPLANEESHQFAVRTIGRIVFCWFLREKQSNQGVPLIDPSILSLEAIKGKPDYYNQILAPLFFEVLNKPGEKRSEKFRQDFFENVPYLNGGLFSPKKPEDYYKLESTHDGENNPKIVLPDEWLQDFFELLETYHFTVDENTSVDIELSRDPEMLGRIFENLLARINPETGETVRKSTGSFYTPREVVEYMVDESLVSYISGQTSISEVKIRALVSYDPTDDLEHPLTSTEKNEAISALSRVKILDPACGSGAFPIGVLQKIVFILQQVDPDAKLWFQDQVTNTSPEIRQLLEREFQQKNFDYIRKLGVIRESIFGVDIQPIATEIARLRCFLTLIVDERVDDNQLNRGVYPLPNLDFKFVTANTLVKLDIPLSAAKEQTGLFEDKSGIYELKLLRDEYFNSHNSERDSLKFQFSEAQKKMLKKIIAANRQNVSNVTQKLSDWSPFSNEATEWFDPEWMYGVGQGFDIVIANPPYIEHKKLKHISKLLKNSYRVYTGSSDLSVYFFERGLELLKKDGTLAFINTNKFFNTEYGAKLREFLLRYQINSLVNFEQVPVFENVLVSSCIINIRKTEAQAKATVGYMGLYRDKGWKDKIQNIKLNPYPTPFLRDAEWSFLPENEIRVKQKISQKHKKLKAVPGIVIRRGITTGYDPAFIIDANTRSSLPEGESIIKPLFKGEHLKRYYTKPTDLYLINSHNGLRHELPPINLPKDHPEIFNYLKSIDEESDQAVSSRSDQGENWYNLRNCAFLKEFEEKKIIWPLTADKWGFAIDDHKHFLASGSFMLVSRSLKLNYLLGLLNSKVMEYYFRHTGVMTAGGAYTLKKSTIEDLPTAIPDNETQDKISQVVTQILGAKHQNSHADTEQLEEQINQFVYLAYNLTAEEILIIEKALA